MPYKLLLLFTYLCLSTIDVSAQIDPHYVTLEEHPKSVRTNFVCKGIIDKRVVKDNIGFVRKGLINKNTVALFRDDFDRTLHNHVNSLIKAGDAPEELFIIVHQLNIGESTERLSEKRHCELEIEFVQQIDSIYYSLGVYSSRNEKYGVEVTNSHNVGISECLLRCIYDFVQTNWLRTAHRKKINIDFAVPSYNYQVTPPKGAYNSFVKVIKNESFAGVDVSMVLRKPKTQIERYKLSPLPTRYEFEYIPFVSDGKDLYIHVMEYFSGKYYVKAKHTGRYIYFEDKFYDKNATIAFGLIGAAASNRLRGMVLDTTNGEVSFLNDHKVLLLLQDYPDLKKAYENSKRGSLEREVAILSLNKMYDK